MEFFKTINVQITTPIYRNPNKPTICNGGKDWNDACTHLAEHSSFCNLFRKQLKEETKGFRKSFKCKECLLAIGQLK